MEDSYDFLFKVLLVGESAVGKTSVLLRYTDKTFTESFQATIGVDFRISTIDVDGKTIKLQLWDTAGQDRYRRIISSYYRGASGVILVYDVTSRESFERVEFWISQCNMPEDLPKILVANKTDLVDKRQVETSEGRTLAERLGIDFIETSAKDNVNIKDIFESLSGKILEAKIQSSSMNGIVIGRGKSIEKKGWCCSQ